MILRPGFRAARPEDHRLLWRIVEGAVADALLSHPDYLTAKGETAAVQSITKRVVGQLVGHATEARKRGPVVASRAESGSTTPI